MKQLNFKSKMVIGLLFGALLTIVSCKKDPEPGPIKAASIPGIKPMNLNTNLGIQGFNFPEDSTVIYKWLANRDTVSIAKHAWGIWAGMTAQSGEIFQGDSLRIFETWMGVKELAKLCADGNSEGGCDVVRTQRTQLSIPKQLIHGQIFSNATLKKKAAIDTTFNIVETVSYDPSAACHATSLLLFNQSTINKFKKPGGIGKIPDFPNSAITTKPTYYAGKPDKNGLIRVPVWPGNPVPAKSFGYNDWKTYVYADINNKQQPNRALTPVTTETPTQAQIAAATCNLSDFINYKIDATMAKYLNEHEDKGKGNDNFKAGDRVILVAMHVGTREINNWTWQSFFWSYNPNTPFFPSSAFEANLRPTALKGAPKHYALDTAYAMVWPNQPITGGTDKGATPIIAFNPYLEGSFQPSFFGFRNTFQPSFQYGVQTNCMSCHALAATFIKGQYCTDMYIDMKDKSYFTNSVQGDFSWSVIDNINKDK